MYPNLYRTCGAIVLLIKTICLRSRNGRRQVPLTRKLKQRRRQRQRKRHLKIYLYFICATSRLFQLAQLLGELSRNQIGRSGVQVKKENEKFTVVRSRSPQNLKCGHFTLLFCRGRQRNVPKCKTHVQSDCFCSLNLLFCGVVSQYWQ